jgi:pyruvate dehydrogenase E2 component (dihydrolipoyllysine-residue acetyltransferase)
MASLLRVPEVAAGATEAVLSEWLVEENAPFVAGEPIVMIETEKAVVEVEAEMDAVVLRKLVPGGSTVEVGSPMALVGAADEANADLDQILADLGIGKVEEKAAPARRDVPERAPMTADSGAPSQPMGATHAAPEPETAPEPDVVRPSADGDTGPGRRFITPIARRMLRDAGLRPEDVHPSGPNGRIVRKDVERAIETSRHQRQAAAVSEPQPLTPAEPSPARPAADRSSSTGYEDIPHSRLRRAVAGRLLASKQSIPHFYVKRTVRIDALLQLRSQLNEVSAQKISVNDLVIRAVAAAHVRVPEANVIWTEDHLRRFESVDIAVAIASDRGLVTPVLRSVEKATPSAIASQVRAYVQQANDGKLQQRDLEGGSISVTNLGMYGVEEFAAIINPPQSAILAVGAGHPEPVVVNGVVEVGTVMSLVLSVDHRAIDGALAAQWLGALVTIIEQPLYLLA